MERYWVWEYGLFEKNPKRVDSLNPETTLEVVKLADAQATVEALQKKYDDLLGKYRQLVDFYDKHNGTPCEQIRHQQQVDALQRVRKQAEQKHLQDVTYMRSQYDSIVAMKDEVQAALDAEREKVKAHERAYQEGHPSPCTLGSLCPYCEIERKAEQLSQLQALVRALPVVRIDLNGAYHDTLLARPEDDAVKELLRYRATLDATTPATTKT